MHERGLTLLEIIMVLAIAGVLFTVAIPRLQMLTGVEASERLSRLVTDVRNAYDSAILYGVPHRLVFRLGTGEYWLEATDRRIVVVSEIDPTEAETEELQEKFNDRKNAWEKMLGEAVTLDDRETKITPSSPLVAAAAKLRPAKWTKRSETEWRVRRLGDFYKIALIQSEHHKVPVRFEDASDQTVAMIYFFPSGLVEKAVVQISENDGSGTTTVWIDPSTGTANFERGEKAYDAIEAYQNRG